LKHEFVYASAFFLNRTPGCSPGELDVGSVGKLHRVLVGEDPWGSPRQPSSHVMIVVVIVVVVVMMVVMVVVVMVVVVLLGECRERREAKCGAEC
jgi:heme/copper-type cytochrome/quinol oxidase subunit 2